MQAKMVLQNEAGQKKKKQYPTSIQICYYSQVKLGVGGERWRERERENGVILPHGSESY